MKCLLCNLTLIKPWCNLSCLPFAFTTLITLCFRKCLETEQNIEFKPPRLEFPRPLHIYRFFLVWHMLKSWRTDSQALSSLASLATDSDILRFFVSLLKVEHKLLACSHVARGCFLAVYILQFPLHHFHFHKVDGGFRLLDALPLIENKGKFIQQLAISQLSLIFILFSPFYVYDHITCHSRLLVILVFPVYFLTPEAKLTLPDTPCSVCWEVSAHSQYLLWCFCMTRKACGFPS